jgi:hypothetical protein
MLKNRQKFRIIFSILLSLLIVYSNTVVSISDSLNISKNDFSKDTYEKKIEYDWYDGYFQGNWGKNKSCLEGEIIGNLNFGRSSTVGNIFGEMKTLESLSYGTINGKFRKNFFSGILKNNDDGSNKLFIGFIFLNDTNLKAVILNPSLPTIRIDARIESSFMPPLSGKYGVGVKSFYLIDESRPENLTPDDPNDVREMIIQIWYPIDKEINTPRAEYMDAPTFAWLKARSPIPLFMIPNNAYLFVRPHMKLEAPIANDNHLYPVIIFSPGYDGVYSIYTSFIENVVSHGFIIVSINHPYVSGITVFPDGREIYVAPIPDDIDEALEFLKIAQRAVVEDAKFVLDTITELNNSDPFFSGFFDLSKVGMFGHSFGGGNTGVCCLEDPRFIAGLTLDGFFNEDFFTDDINKPFLMMVAESRYFNDSSTQFMWEHLINDTYKVGIIGSTHYGYTDVGVLLKHFVPLIPINLLGFGSISPKNMVNITRSIVLMFFETYLKDNPIEDLLNLLNYFDEVKYEIK